MQPPDPLYLYKGDMKPVNCLMYRHVDGNHFLFAGTLNGIVHVWDLKSNRETGKFAASKESCLSILYSCETDEIITQDKLGVFRFWKMKDLDFSLVKEIRTDHYGFCKCVIHGELLVVPLKNAFLEFVCLKKKEKVNLLKFTYDDKLNEIMCFKVFDLCDETLALIAYETCSLNLWNIKNTTLLGQIGIDECPMALEFDATSRKGICGTPTEKLLVFTINEYFKIEFKRHIILKNPGVASLSIRPDGKILAVGSWDGRIRIYSMKNLAILAVLDIHSSTIQDVIFLNCQLPNEQKKFYLVGASKDCKISFWDLYN